MKVAIYLGLALAWRKALKAQVNQAGSLTYYCEGLCAVNKQEKYLTVYQSLNNFSTHQGTSYPLCDSIQENMWQFSEKLLQTTPFLKIKCYIKNIKKEVKDKIFY